jgi:NADPH-dependent 2,4-dienoyl-CoA reductase/sulfur reductase-like enzyme
VLAAIGAAPRTALAEAAGLALADPAEGGGIAVDASLRTSDPDVFAAGDVAAVDHPLLGRRVRVEHWANAKDGGPAAARAMLGQPVSYDRVPYFFTDQYDLGMEFSGHAAPGTYDQVVARGDVGKREFIAFWLRDDRVLAGMNVNVWDVTDPIQELIRSGRQVDPERLSDPSVPLENC